MVKTWMRTNSGEFIDPHNEILSHRDLLELLGTVEAEGSLRAYVNGGNGGGRWIFQFYSREFVSELARIVNGILEGSVRTGPVLEVMAGDGVLTEALRPHLTRPIVATDAKTGRSRIAHPKWVTTMDAVSAVMELRPAVVLMSWEPFFSDTAVRIVENGDPLVWIGDPKSCGVGSGLFDTEHIRMDSPYAIGRHDSIVTGTFRTDIYLFNCDAPHTGM